MDEMTIVGKDGKSRFKVAGDNEVLDLRAGSPATTIRDYIRCPDCKALTTGVWCIPCQKKKKVKKENE